VGKVIGALSVVMSSPVFGEHAMIVAPIKIKISVFFILICWMIFMPFLTKFSCFVVVKFN
jgi:hypothetical protein